jgi:cob(I)alamin adenosyltransferase
MSTTSTEVVEGLSLWARTHARELGDFMVPLPWRLSAFLGMCRGLTRRQRRALYVSVLARDAVWSLAARVGSGGHHG